MTMKPAYPTIEAVHADPAARRGYLAWVAERGEDPHDLLRPSLAQDQTARFCFLVEQTPTGRIRLLKARVIPDVWHEDIQNIHPAILCRLGAVKSDEGAVLSRGETIPLEELLARTGVDQVTPQEDGTIVLEKDVTVTMTPIPDEIPRLLRKAAETELSSE